MTAPPVPSQSVPTTTTTITSNSATPTCATCGAPIPNGAHFCANCGSKVAA
ncbi:MAG TPA: zinc-ribbon domain-containing protein [Nitrolancea sp.]|nr:zinc-ribbon domain-containing protein [Nitrolancea sp.]